MRGAKIEVSIGKNIGTLKVNSFLQRGRAGKHGVLLRHVGINRGAGGIDTIEIDAGGGPVFLGGHHRQGLGRADRGQVR